MRNKVQNGESITFTASGAVSSGDVVVVGQLLVIAATDVANGADGEGEPQGVFTCAKTAGEAWTKGAALMWDASASAFVVQAGKTPATGDVTNAAVAWAAAASADTTGEVELRARIGTVA